MSKLCFQHFKIFLLTILTVIQSGQANDNKSPVFIMFVGLSGSGKSSTVNTMLNRNITQEGLGESTTSEILEFSIKTSGGNVELRIIDTPGLQDTRGLETDARFLATLEDYLDTHEFLSTRPPDVIVICQRFDDNRFADEKAEFIKMLKSITTFQNRLIHFSETLSQDSAVEAKNVLFTLTHFMGVNLKIQKSPNGKLGDFRRAVKQYTSLPGENVPMVLAENSGDAQELESVLGGHKLPNGEIYPENLCNELFKVIRNQRPDLTPADIKICKGQDIQLNVELLTNISLVEISHPKAMKQLSALMAVNTNAADSEVSRQLAAAYTKLTSDKGNSTSLASTLGYLQISLHNWRIFNITDIPPNDISVAELYRKLKKDSGTRRLLETAFKLKSPRSTPFSLLAGHGYSFVQDNIVPTYPFKFLPADYVSCLGYVLPRGMECKIIKPIKLNQLVNDVTSMDEYISNRAAALGVSKHVFFGVKRLVNLKPGYTLPKSEKRSFYIEFQAVEIEFQNFELSESFKSVLDQLPRFSASIQASIAAYEELFAMYGTHVVTKIYYGGSIEFLLSKDLEFDAVNSFERVLSLIKKYNNLMKININGGDLKLHSSNPSIFFSESKGISLFSRWKTSLLRNPIPLIHTPTTLISFSSILRSTGRDQIEIQEVEKALSFFHSSDYITNGQERILKVSLNTCSNEKESTSAEFSNCDNAFKSRETNCKAQVTECQKLEDQIVEIRSEKLHADSEIFHAKQSLLMKELENYRVRLKKDEVEGSLKSVESNLKSVREQLNKEKEESTKLKAALAKPH